jgi:hypothetical protein
MAPVSFRGAGATTARATFALGSARMRDTVFNEWRTAADAAGFPTAGAEMILAVTNQRVLVCSKTFWLGRLAQADGSILLERIAEVATVRHGMVMGCAFALTNGHIVEVEAMRGRRLRRFARRVLDAKAGPVG